MLPSGAVPGADRCCVGGLGVYCVWPEPWDVEFDIIVFSVPLSISLLRSFKLKNCH